MAPSSSSKMRITVLHGAWIVTMDPELRIFSDGAVVVEGDRIKAVGPSGDVLASFAAHADEMINLSGFWVIPGLINTHVHTSQQLARGIADDVDLLTWLHERIWPFESHMTVDDSYLSTLLCGIELIHSGVQLMAKASVKVSHCPASNLRMLGFAPIQEMLTAGICVSLGTDGAPSNNRMSLVDEMYLASLIHKGKVVFTKGTTDPSALPAECILKMATTAGAEAVLQERDIGSLEIGKKADLVVINPNSWTMTPVHDPIASLVYCMRTENIDSVMCDGQWIMRSQRILTVDEAAILPSAKEVSAEIVKRAKINIPKRMNII